MNKKKTNLSGAFAFVLAILILAVFVPINMIFSYSDKVYDLTPSKKYSLDPITKQLLDDCSDKHIDVYFLNSLFNLKSDANCLPVYHTLTELDARDNITLTCFDPNEDVELANSLNPTGAFTVSRNDIFVKCDDNIRQISGNLFQTDSNGIVEYAGENLIAGAIYLCTTGNLPTVYFITGYSDKTLADDYSSYRDVVRGANYKVGELDLSAGPIPSDAAILCLAAPTKDLSDADREKLSSYVDNGGALQMLLPPCDTPGRFENIEYILAKFELGMDYNIIKEQNYDWQLRNPDNEQDPAYFVVTYPSKSDDASEDLTTDINTLIANGTYVSGVSNIRSFYELTSASALIEKASIIENLPTSMDSGEFTALSEPMGGDKTTADVAKSKSNEPLVMGYYSYNKQTGAKLIVVGCDEPIDDTLNPTTFGTRRLIQFSNSWLYNSDVDMGIQNKFNSYDTMVFEDGKEATAVIRLIFIVPVLFAVVGLAVWLKRRYA